MFCGILNQTHVTNSHSFFGDFFWFSGKCVFDEKMRFVIYPKHPSEGPSFWLNGLISTVHIFMNPKQQNQKMCIHGIWCY